MWLIGVAVLVLGLVLVYRQLARRKGDESFRYSLREPVIVGSHPEKKHYPPLDTVAAGLRDELIQIGYRSPAEQYENGRPLGTTWFLRKRQRVREIGAILHERGGIDLMRQVHDEVSQALGGSSGRELEVAWDGVGDWAG